MIWNNCKSIHDEYNNCSYWWL